MPGTSKSRLAGIKGIAYIRDMIGYMKIPRYFLFLLAMLVLAAGCKKKKKVTLSGEDPVDIKDFMEFFQPLRLPFYYADSNLRQVKKRDDSLLISYKVFTQLVPDTVLIRVYGKGVKPKIYALGKAAGPAGEVYLVVKAVNGEKRSVLLLCFDKKNSFMSYLAALRPDLDASTQQSMTLDRRLTITKTVLRKNRDGTMSEGKDVYAMNMEKRSFYLVMTDALDDKPTELINPIDTLPRKNKWSADYVNGKMNLVSVRDGKRSSKLFFFIHFEKNNGECSGELKGDADITSATTAEYRKDGDPCKLQFIFTGSSVRLKEIEGCGSYRPLKCSFDGSFIRKKEVKPKTTAVKKSSRSK